MLKTILASTLAVFQVNAISFDFESNLEITDFESAGTFDRQLISTEIESLSDVNVSIQISGEFNGDLYALLVHEPSGAYSVLLNRIGKTSGNVLGSASDGMNILLDDQAGADVHTISLNAGLLTGTFQADGRELDPLLVLENSDRSATLSNFEGIDPNGHWTLMIADLNLVGESRLEGWGLHFNTASSVPDALAAGWMLLPVAALILASRGFSRTR